MFSLRNQNVHYSPGAGFFSLSLFLSFSLSLFLSFSLSFFLSLFLSFLIFFLSLSSSLFLPQTHTHMHARAHARPRQQLCFISENKSNNGWKPLKSLIDKRMRDHMTSGERLKLDRSLCLIHHPARKQTDNNHLV